MIKLFELEVGETKKERKKIEKREYDKIYREKNKEKRQKNDREYYQNNKEKSNKRNNIYYQKNKERIDKCGKEGRYKYYNKRRKEDPLFRLRLNISRLFNYHLKSQGTSKQGKSCMSFVSYTIQELRNHLESLFLPGMSWNNYGINGWVIDHINPSIFFNALDYTEIRMCWRLDNLQPMWAKDNKEKQDKMMLHSKEVNARDIVKDYRNNN